MTDADAPVSDVLEQLARTDRSAALALHALLVAAGDDGVAAFNEAARIYRDDHLAALRAAGRDADAEAGKLGVDHVREYLATSVIPRLTGLADRKSTRLNSSHVEISYAVFCLK